MTPYGMGGVEQVVLLDESGRAVGTAPKHSVHHARTPLHLAFSCYVFDDRGRLLVTRRALTKTTWPGAWTNTVCGHPGPGEGVLGASRRRASDELGIALYDVRVVLADYRYRAVMANGVVENEMCPVLVARSDDDPEVDPAEVADTSWEPWTDFTSAVQEGRREVSPWCLDQLGRLTRLGPDPGRWRSASDSELPAAGRFDARAGDPG